MGACKDLHIRPYISIFSTLIIISEDDSPFEEDHEYDFCQRLYMGACKDLHITPINLVLKHFATNRLAIVGVVLSKKDAKACAIALLVSQS